MGRNTQKRGNCIDTVKKFYLSNLSTKFPHSHLIKLAKRKVLFRLEITGYRINGLCVGFFTRAGIQAKRDNVVKNKSLRYTF